MKQTMKSLFTHLLGLAYLPLYCSIAAQAAIIPRKTYATTSVQNADMVRLRQAINVAKQRHVNHPDRCSMFKALQMIEHDMQSVYKRQTGKLPPDCGGYKCTHCSILFDDFTQATFHDCSSN